MEKKNADALEKTLLPDWQRRPGRGFSTSEDQGFAVGNALTVGRMMEYNIVS